MAIPLSYNIRNLLARRTTTVITALGIALTVAVLLSVMAMVEGLRTSLDVSGNPLHVIVTRKGSNAELNSTITRAAFQDVKFKPGIARTSSGEPMASLEVVTVIILESPEAPAGININLRGLTPLGFSMREALRISEGRMFRPGRREVVVGTFVAIIMSIGSSFAAMNTMYAAIARRGAEIGTLRVLGFSKAGILTSFLLESLVLSLLGGIIGCLLVLPLNNLTTGIGSFLTFSEITFDLRVTPAIMAIGIAFALLMGTIGGLFSATSAARKQILAALRQV